MARPGSGLWEPEGYGLLAVLLLVVVSFIQVDDRMKVRPDHAFQSLLIIALVLEDARRLLADRPSLHTSPGLISWSGFVIFLVVFERGPLRRILSWRPDPPNSVPEREPDAIAAR